MANETNAAIYSAGLSIHQLVASNPFAAHADSYGLRIGINSGFDLLPDGFCHWYSAGDHQAYEAQYTAKRPSVGWCCICEEYRGIIMSRDIGWSAFESLTWEDLRYLKEVSIPSYSITAAIALAAQLGAERITLFAHDCAVGKPNANGAGSDNYPEDRAKKEAQELADITRIVSGWCTIIKGTI
jgi:hypothetical protein